MFNVLAAANELAAPAPFSQEQAVARALGNNIDIAALRFSIAEAKARVAQAGRLSNPEVESELTPVLNGREHSWRVGFNQKFPLTARLRIEKEISRLQLSLAEAELQNFERNIAFETRTAFARLAALHAQLKLKDQQAHSLDQLRLAIANAVKVGEGAEMDQVLLELDLSELASQRLKLDSERLALERALKLLLGMGNEHALDIHDNLDLPASVGHMSHENPSRPDELIARIRAETAERKVKLAGAHRWEDASIGFFGGLDRREDAPEGLRSDSTAGIRFSVPLPLWKNKRAAIGEARASADRTAKELEAITARIESETTSAREHMEAAFKQAEIIAKELLPKAVGLEKRLADLSKEGQASYMEVARARSRRLQLESAQLDLRRDFHLARAAYWKALGIIRRDQ